MKTINYEQLEAELTHGARLAVELRISITTAAHLIMAAQCALLQPNLSAGSALVLRQFAMDAEKWPVFGAETRKLLAAGWEQPT